MARIAYAKTFKVLAMMVMFVVVFMINMINENNSKHINSLSDSKKMSSNSNDMNNINNSKDIYSLSNSEKFLSNSKIILSDLLYWRKIVCQKVGQPNSKKKSTSKDPKETPSQFESYLSNSKNWTKYAYNDDSKQRRLTQAIIIGAMKCGTLALKTMIEMHSKVVSSEHELQFFDWKYHQGLDWYQSKMPLSYSNQVVLEKSPSYFRNVLVPTRMNNMDSSMRLILIVKDPTSRSISEYTHHKAHERCPMSFKNLVIRPDGEVEANHPIIMQSMYFHFLKNYLEVFPPEQILVLGGEQLVSDPLPVIKNVERFLNLEPEITEDNIYFDKEKGYFCMSHNGTIECLPDDKGREHPEVDEDVLTKLRTFFAPYNQRFYDLVGQDFGWPTS